MRQGRSRVLLVHGMGRTAWSMRRLARHLRVAGHETTLLGYLAAVEPFEAIVDRVHRDLQRLAGGAGPYAVVGHSLGGLLVRVALARRPPLPVPPARLIMLGTPNRPPRLANRYRRLWPYRWVNGESGRLLATPDFFAALPAPPVPYTIIAGTGGWQGRWSPFGREPNDGVVAVSETLVGETDVPIQLPVRHTFMMNDRRVREAIRGALPPP
ncbi:MAG: esterase/lipase family protein [Gemmatimonadales bacterium]